MRQRESGAPPELGAKLVVCSRIGYRPRCFLPDNDKVYDGWPKFIGVPNALADAAIAAGLVTEEQIVRLVPLPTAGDPWK